MHFFDISASKGGSTLVCFVHLTWKCASRHNSVSAWKCASRRIGLHFFILIWPDGSAPRRFSEPAFRPCGATNHRKSTVNRDFSTFSLACIFFLLTLSLIFSLLLFSSLLFSSLSLPTSAFPCVHIVGSLTSKLPSIISPLNDHWTWYSVWGAQPFTVHWFWSCLGWLVEMARASIFWGWVKITNQHAFINSRSSLDRWVVLSFVFFGINGILYVHQLKGHFFWARYPRLAMCWSRTPIDALEAQQVLDQLAGGRTPGRGSAANNSEAYNVALRPKMCKMMICTLGIVCIYIYIDIYVYIYIYCMYWLIHDLFEFYLRLWGYTRTIVGV